MNARLPNRLVLQQPSPAGFLLAAAVLIPGNRPRRDALRENACRAIRLIAASAVLLIAGTPERFEAWPLSRKLAVSAVTAAFLVI